MPSLISRRASFAFLAILATAAAVRADSKAEQIMAELGVHGGLCVQIGAEDVDGAGELAASGRYLIQVLDADERIVDGARQTLHATGCYGLVSVDRLPGQGMLPYTEDLVNLIFVTSQPSAMVSLEEVRRVLCPNGVVVIGTDKATREQLATAGFTDLKQTGDQAEWCLARKPRPEAMDEWTHSRHASDGNPASTDTLVAPPRRVRWIAGAESEVRGMVTASGRNFYAGVLARDSFNGLRLWNRDIVAPGSADFVMKNLRSAPPVAGGNRLFVVEQKKLLALDAASGEVVHEYAAAGEPKEVLFDRGTLIVATSDSVRALYADSGDVRWQLSFSDPRQVVAGDDTVALIHGQARRNEAIEAVIVDRETGQIRWKRNDLEWLPKVDRLVYHGGLVAFEVSTFNNDGPENALHLLSAASGEVQLDHPFFPGMNHARQARAMFVSGNLWLLHGGRGAGDERFPVQVSAIDMKTGNSLVTHPAGLTHCFPPVMTSRYMIAGEFDLTDLSTGTVDANHITKAACGPDGGWVPANGLIYVTPKHCVCWPMLRGYTALASERPAGDIGDMKVDEIEFPLEKGAEPPTTATTEDDAQDWPVYRHDAWRSGSTTGRAPAKFDTIWSADLGPTAPDGIITHDWEENMFVKGPITPPAIAGERVVVARPDAHEVVALDAGSGKVAWRFTAAGRVDTTPTLHKGLCLFGSKAGWVYCLRADDGQLVWRLRAAPVEEQIVTYGQLESPWPVPGSVLIVDDVAYFAAGRQSLADGGILICAVEPTSGKIRWVQRLDSVPQTNFYDSSGLEFDNFDLLYREGDNVSMSRWSFDRKSGEMSIDRWAVFAKLDTGGGAVMAPRGCWTYAPRHQARIKSYQPLRPLAVYRDKALFGSLQGSSTVFRRDFNLEGGEQFDTKWMTGWAASSLSQKGEMPWPNHRLAEKAAWKTDPLGTGKDAPPIHAMALAGDKLLLVGGNGELRVLAAGDGSLLHEAKLPEPLWDGMAVARGRVFYSTRDGKVLCLGE
ncbi:MAG: PQQ-binding-like beta-propeller repeat protein [Planctomycetaceae bacterium]|nr:PQQ-binding-like beta-propeller repeat protein [Planctomycetaceae bacterium]